MFSIGILVPVVLLVLLILSGVRIVNEYEQGVVLRLGRFAGVRTAGLNLIVPFVDRLIVIDMRVTAEQVPPQDVITRDNVSVKVNAVIFFRVMDPRLAVLEVSNFLYATSQLAQTTLRSVLGEAELDELLSQRGKLNLRLQSILDQHTASWGMKVTLVEVKQVELAEQMIRAIARQAEAERERLQGYVRATDGVSLTEWRRLIWPAGFFVEHPLMHPAFGIAKPHAAEADT